MDFGYDIDEMLIKYVVSVVQVVHMDLGYDIDEMLIKYVVSGVQVVYVDSSL